MKALGDSTIAVIGLGYVGLPLAIEFGKHYPTTGFDINEQRIGELRDGIDSTREVTKEDIKQSVNLSLSSDPRDISNCNVYIVTVPTPIDQYKKPDLRPLKSASEMIAGVISSGDVVIYESTVYPGCTEEECIPVIEKISGLEYGKDFTAGYSPERINPGDTKHKLKNILKVTSGTDTVTSNFVDALYGSVISAGTYKAENIRVAEAAKVIENTQRDLNIALVNELAILFDRLDIDTQSVLDAAATKWNFLPFNPGLVGGHCIGVDPYYLTHKAQEIGYHPDIILAGRRINDEMGKFVADSVIKLMLKKRIQVVDANILVLGFAFKENCPDLRNTRVIDIVETFREYSANVDVYDPWIEDVQAREEYGIELIHRIEPGTYDAVVLCVAHNEFRKFDGEQIRSWCNNQFVVYDVKGIFDPKFVDGRL